MRRPLDIYDDMPRGMKKYISNYGFHFSKKMCEYAVKRMRDRDGKTINTFDMERTEDFLQKHGITLKNDTLYDKVYVLNMAIADYFMSSIPDEQRLANFVRDTLDDYDGCDDSVFRRYIATEIGKGDPIEWDDML